MKRIFLFLFFIIGMGLGINASAQVPMDVKDPGPDSIGVFTLVDVMPQFPGGENALRDFLIKNIRYPETAREMGIEGRVYIRFVVDVDGSVTDVKLARGIDKSLDNEALRVVRSMPPWKPGMQNGKPVKVYFNLPIRFKLE